METFSRNQKSDFVSLFSPKRLSAKEHWAISGCNVMAIYFKRRTWQRPTFLTCKDSMRYGRSQGCCCIPWLLRKALLVFELHRHILVLKWFSLDRYTQLDLFAREKILLHDKYVSSHCAPTPSLRVFIVCKVARYCSEANPLFLAREEGFGRLSEFYSRCFEVSRCITGVGRKTWKTVLNFSKQFCYDYSPPLSWYSSLLCHWLRSYSVGSVLYMVPKSKSPRDF